MAVGIVDTPYPNNVTELAERIQATLDEINGSAAEQVDPAWWVDVWESAKGHCYRLGLPDAVADDGRLAPENLITPDLSSPAARAIRDRLRNRLVDLKLRLTGEGAGDALATAGEIPVKYRTRAMNKAEAGRKLGNKSANPGQYVDRQIRKGPDGGGIRKPMGGGQIWFFDIRDFPETVWDSIR